MCTWKIIVSYVSDQSIKVIKLCFLLITVFQKKTLTFDFK